MISHSLLSAQALEAELRFLLANIFIFRVIITNYHDRVRSIFSNEDLLVLLLVSLQVHPRPYAGQLFPSFSQLHHPAYL